MEVVEPRSVSLSAVSSLAMMMADLVKDVADEYRQAQYNMLDVLKFDKGPGRLWRQRMCVCVCVSGI